MARPRGTPNGVLGRAASIAKPLIVDGLAYSTLLSPKCREHLIAVISRCEHRIGISPTDVEEVDRLYSCVTRNVAY